MTPGFWSCAHHPLSHHNDGGTKEVQETSGGHFFPHYGHAQLLECNNTLAGWSMELEGIWSGCSGCQQQWAPLVWVEDFDASHSIYNSIQMELIVIDTIPNTQLLSIPYSTSFVESMPFWVVFVSNIVVRPNHRGCEALIELQQSPFTSSNRDSLLCGDICWRNVADRA